jgi:hypothetical protein
MANILKIEQYCPQPAVELMESLENDSRCGLHRLILALLDKAASVRG